MNERKGWIQTGFTAVIALIAGLVGSTYQQYQNTNLANKKLFDEWRRDAYIRYLNAMEKGRLAEEKELASKAPGTPSSMRKQLQKQAASLRDDWEIELGTATLTLAAFGESKVIRALAEHWRQDEREKAPKNKLVLCLGKSW